MAAEESRLEMAETQLDRASTPACRGQRPGLCSVGLPAWKERARVAPPRDDYLEQSSGSALRLLHPPVSSYLIRKALGRIWVKPPATDVAASRPWDPLFHHRC